MRTSGGLASLLLLSMDGTSGDAAPQSKLSGSKVRWGIMGTGSIASDFTKVLKQLDDVEVAAVGSRTVERATEFANAHELDSTTTTLHESYEVCHRPCHTRMPAPPTSLSRACSRPCPAGADRR